MRGPEDAGLAASRRASSACMCSGASQPQASMPITRTPLLVQPARRLGGHAGPRDDVVGRAVERVAAGADQHDVERPELVAGGRERGLDLGARDRVAVRLGREVEHDAGREEPLERQLVDRLRRLAARSSSCSARARRRASSCACRGCVIVSTAQPSPSRSSSGRTPKHASIRRALGVARRTRCRCAARRESRAGSDSMAAERSTKRMRADDARSPCASAGWCAARAAAPPAWLRSGGAMGPCTRSRTRRAGSARRRPPSTSRPARRAERQPGAARRPRPAVQRHRRARPRPRRSPVLL